MNENKYSEIESVLELDTDALLAELGEAIAGTSMKPKRVDRYIEIARNWLTVKRSELQSVVCNNEEVIEASKIVDEHERRVNIVSVLIDALSVSFSETRCLIRRLNQV